MMVTQLMMAILIVVAAIASTFPVVVRMRAARRPVALPVVQASSFDESLLQYLTDEDRKELTALGWVDPNAPQVDERVLHGQLTLNEARREDELAAIAKMVTRGRIRVLPAAPDPARADQYRRLAYEVADADARMAYLRKAEEIERAVTVTDRPITVSLAKPTEQERRFEAYKDNLAATHTIKLWDAAATVVNQTASRSHNGGCVCDSCISD